MASSERDIVDGFSNSLPLALRIADALDGRDAIDGRYPLTSVFDASVPVDQPSGSTREVAAAESTAAPVTATSVSVASSVRLPVLKRGVVRCRHCSSTVRRGMKMTEHLALMHAAIYPLPITSSRHASFASAERTLKLTGSWQRTQYTHGNASYSCASAATSVSLRKALAAESRLAEAGVRLPTGDSRDRKYARSRGAGLSQGPRATAKSARYCPAFARIVVIPGKAPGVPDAYNLSIFPNHTDHELATGYDKTLSGDVKSELAKASSLTVRQVRSRVIAAREEVASASGGPLAVPTINQVAMARRRSAPREPSVVKSSIEGLLEIFGDSRLAQIAFDMRAAGSSDTLDFSACRRLATDLSPGAVTARATWSEGLTLLDSDQVVIISDNLTVGKLFTAKVLCTDAGHNIEASSKMTAIIAIVAVDSNDVASLAAIAVATSVSRATLAHIFLRLNELVKKTHSAGITADTLLHDMVSIPVYCDCVVPPDRHNHLIIPLFLQVRADFAALCAVLPHLRYQHYCIWHALDKFEARVKKCVTSYDHLSASLQAAVDRKTITFDVARTQHCQDIVDEYACILLGTDRDVAVVRLEMFIRAHKNIPGLLAVLSSDRSPYYEIEAFLLSCTRARAINALCENVMRCLRKFQASAGVARRPFVNFAGVVMVAIWVLGFMRSSARQRQRQAEKSVRDRAAQASLVAKFTAAASPFTL